MDYFSFFASFRCLLCFVDFHVFWWPDFLVVWKSWMCLHVSLYSHISRDANDRYAQLFLLSATFSLISLNIERKYVHSPLFLQMTNKKKMIWKCCNENISTYVWMRKSASDRIQYGNMHNQGFPGSLWAFGGLAVHSNKARSPVSLQRHRNVCNFLLFRTISLIKLTILPV